MHKQLLCFLVLDLNSQPSSAVHKCSHTHYCVVVNNGQVCNLVLSTVPAALYHLQLLHDRGFSAFAYEFV